MSYQIKNRWTGEVLWTSETSDSLMDALVLAASSRANLCDADLCDADLCGANLRDANLRRANLCDADLRGADLRGADLCVADLCDADLCGAYLSGADLRGADLRGADLTPLRDDLWAVLSSSPAEAIGLRAAIIEGRIDGSTYRGECACLVGTIANVRKCDVYSIPGLSPDSSRPIERFFLAISPGDVPEKSQPARIALEWIDQWLANIRSAIPQLGKSE